MKNILRITAILNLLLVVTALLFTFMSAMAKNVEFLAVSVLLVIVSLFPTTTMIALCNEFNEADK